MYKPHRDYRFEYLYEAMEHIEETQCIDCKFVEPGEYPMCVEISGKFLMEEPIEEIEDLGNDGLRCTLRQPLEVEENS